MDVGAKTGVLIAASALALLTGCAGTGTARVATAPPRDAAVGWPPEPAPLPADVSRIGLVIEDDEGPRMCLGPIADSYPPQCSGPPVLGWDWNVIAGETTAVGTSWGEYFVEGVWDGEVFTVVRPSEPVVLSAPTGAVDPYTGLTCGSEDGPVLPELREVRDDIVMVGTWLASGCVEVEVEYDDGRLQAAVDERFGERAVIITSSFDPLVDD